MSKYTKDEKKYLEEVQKHNYLSYDILRIIVSKSGCNLSPHDKIDILDTHEKTTEAYFSEAVLQLKMRKKLMEAKKVIWILIIANVIAVTLILMSILTGG